MKNPLISVIIPVFNTGTSAQKLIQKLLKDKYQNLEIIAVDDGSSDDSLSQLRSIKSDRLKIYHQMNKGAASARNLGLQKVTGKYLVFIDSDDEVSPNFISALAKEIQKPQTDLALTGFLYHRLKQNTTSEVFLSPQPPKSPKQSQKAYILKLLNFDGRLYSSVNKIFKASIIKQNQLKFEEGIDFAEDTRFVLNYLKYSSGDIISVPKPLYIYNYGTATSTVSSSSLKWSNWQKSYQFIQNWLGPNPSKAEKYQLKKLKLRWKISHALAVARSDQSFNKKLQHLNPFLLIFAEIAKRLRP